MNEISDEESVIENEDQRRRVERLVQHAQAPCLKARGGRIDDAYGESPPPLPFWKGLCGLSLRGVRPEMYRKTLVFGIIYVPQRSGATR